MLPGVDYMSYACMGTVFPDSLLYETVCKWCARKSDFAADANSNTSSSSEDEK